MELNTYFKAVVDADPTIIIICNLEHQIIYMNKAAIKSQAHRGGAALIGRCLFDCHNPHSVEMINKVVAWFKESPENNMLFTHYKPKDNRDVYMMALRDDNGELIGYYEKHCYRTKVTDEPYSAMTKA